jgi:hypothetical protein
MNRYGLPCLLSDGILDEEKVRLPVNIKIHLEIWTEDVGILCDRKKVCRELREPSDLSPNNFSFPFVNLSSSIHEATTVDESLKH